MTVRQAVALVGLSAVILASPSAVDGASSEDLLLEGESAYQRGDFTQARIDFGEFLRRYPDDPAADVARLRAGQAAMELADYEVAAAQFRSVYESGGPLAERASYLTGLAFYRARDYGRADVAWSETVRRVEDQRTAARAQYGRAWCAIRQTDWDSARQYLDRMGILFADEPLTRRAQELRRSLGRADALPTRSPSKAEWMSTFLPGSGQMYAGHAANGLVSTALNGAFFTFTAKAAIDGRWLDVGFLYLLGSRFYFGGRHNAEKFARRYNQHVVDDYVEGLSRFEE